MKALTRPLDNMRIGRRLAAVFALCGIFIFTAAYVGLSSQFRSDTRQQEINAVIEDGQIGDDLLVAINDVTGWQGLYVADAAAFGVDRALGEDGYNRQGLDDAAAGVEKLFADADLDALNAEERAIVEEAERHFDQFFAEDVKIRELLRTEGISALPGIMKSINGGEAGEAWSAVYDTVDKLRTTIADRVEVERADLVEMKERGRITVYVGLVIAVTLALVMLRYLVRSITRPLDKTVGVIRSLAEGHLDNRLTVESGDEIGVMSGALNEALDSLSSAMAGMDANAQALASASEELSSVSGQMTGSAQESASQAGLVSAAAEQVSRNVQTVATGCGGDVGVDPGDRAERDEAAGVAAQAVGVAESTNGDGGEAG